MNANESLDFLREKLTAAHERCTILVSGQGVIEVPTVKDALNLMDPFIAKGWDDGFYPKTPIWSPLFPYWWWVEPATTQQR